ncbi:MAG: hypothetical protein CVU91_09220 [Firmicutes bacterium HGW-Firmicutes-16]|nr:MAG: hypothetical protein CVU91_09220 [Firmicutes bacterium HGW-Firmicutes-16]
MAINQTPSFQERYNYLSGMDQQTVLPPTSPSTHPRDVMPVIPGIQPPAVLPSVNPVPATMESPFYMAGLLRWYIGQYMRVQYLIGTNGPLIDRNGVLREVGVNYIILQPQNSDDLVISDLYSIKFIDIIR